MTLLDMTAENLITVQDVARVCRVNPKTVRRWISAGKLGHHKLGTQIRISPNDFDAFLSQHRVAPVDFPGGH